MTASDQGLLHRDPNFSYPVLVKGEGIYFYDEAGNRYIDGTAGAGNVTLGHGRLPIVEAMADQGSQLAYCFSTFFTNRPALDYARRLTELAPGDLNYVYFVSGGSEAVETAIKLARFYHLQRGKAQKYQVIGRWRGYHGATLGALAATGMPGLRASFEPYLPSFPHIASCYPYRCPFAGCQDRCNLTCARQLEETIRQVGADNIAAFIAEPVVMAGIAAGTPPPDYYPLIRQICDQYDILFIADEIITGFGRTGKLFAIEHWDVVPDIITFGKGASSGYSPLGGVLLTDAMQQGLSQQGQALPHVFTYVNNPVAMRAGLAVLDLMDAENTLEHATQVGAYLQEKAQVLMDHPAVGQVRGKGLTLGLELVQDRQTRKPFPPEWGVSKRIPQLALERGLALSGTSGGADWVEGDDIRFYPPLIITRAQIDEALAIIDECLGLVERDLRQQGWVPGSLAE
ncbi:MAG: aminotransferase class III-fold pyridoxal phosphate-dependent enzyme [Candidatus Latescibacteria bacterium]|nr:aminotransferase class III-fold pyridoxal phosphate-dependent enzyme [Candidatus Latescibacterota bacterium]